MSFSPYLVLSSRMIEGGNNVGRVLGCGLLTSFREWTVQKEGQRTQSQKSWTHRQRCRTEGSAVVPTQLRRLRSADQIPDGKNPPQHWGGGLERDVKSSGYNGIGFNDI